MENKINELHDRIQLFECRDNKDQEILNIMDDMLCLIREKNYSSAQAAKIPDNKG